MRGLSGYATLTNPLGSVRERETFTCGHCNSIRHTEPYARGFLVPLADGTFAKHEFLRCGQCDRLICEQCAGKECLPFEKKLREHEQAAALYDRVKRGG